MTLFILDRKIILLIFLFTISLQISAQNTDTLQFPFIERFSDGSLEVNNWTKDSENWQIETDSGTPPPSVRFKGDPEIIGIYNRSLTSNWISKANMGIYPKIYLMFNYQMHANDSVMPEKMFIEIFDSNQWKTLDIIEQSTSGWKNYRKKIDLFIQSDNFKIRFRISGLNSSAGEYWGLDNIFICNGAIQPSNLVGNYYWAADTFGVLLQWYDDQPQSGIQPQTHCRWPWGEGNSSIGMQNGGNWSWAAKFDTLLFESDSLPLTGIVAYIGDTNFDSLDFKIWRGSNGDILEYSVNITSQLTPNQLNKLYFNPPLMMYDTSEIWAGFTVYGQEAGSFPAGYEMEDPVIGKGDLIKMNDTLDWDTLSNYDIEGNWSLYLYYYYGFYHELGGYNIYRKSGQDDSYALYEHLNFTGSSDNSYFDKYPNVDIQTPYWYKVSDVYIDHSYNPAIEYESLPAYAPAGDDDFVMVFVTSCKPSVGKGNLIVYPNPAVNNIHIKSPSAIDEISIYGLNGSLVFSQDYQGQEDIILDASNYKKGLYLIKIKSGVRVFANKIVLY